MLVKLENLVFNLGSLTDREGVIEYDPEKREVVFTATFRDDIYLMTQEFEEVKVEMGRLKVTISEEGIHRLMGKLPRREPQDQAPDEKM
jgi:hypothetical protein